MSESPCCPVCGDPVHASRDLACASCASPHHPDCWRFSGGCSRFGCGDTVSRPLAEVLEEGASRGALVIDEGTPVALPARSLLLTLWRRIKGPARVLPWTVGMGLVGAAVATGVICLHEAPPNDFLLFVSLIGSGGLHGLLAPYLAPRQHRSPMAMTAVGMGLFLLVFGAADSRWLNKLPEFFQALILTLGLVGATIGCTSLAEALLGPRSRLGQALGRASLPARLLATWGVAIGLWLVMAWMNMPHYFRLGWTEILKAGELALLAALPAFPAMERGKAEFRGWFPESRKSPEALSGAGAPGASLPES